jgi:hypothetical protein
MNLPRNSPGVPGLPATPAFPWPGPGSPRPNLPTVETDYANDKPRGRGFPTAYNLDLSVARVNEPLYCQGNAVWCNNQSSSGAEFQISFSKGANPIDFPRGSFIGELDDFSVIFITNSAQAGETAQLTIGKGFRVF